MGVDLLKFKRVNSETVLRFRSSHESSSVTAGQVTLREGLGIARGERHLARSLQRASDCGDRYRRVIMGRGRIA